MPRVDHFEIHSLDPEKAADFYSSIFGWEIKKWEGPHDYWLIYTGEGRGIDGGLMRRFGPAPAEGAPVCSYVNSIGVENLDEIVQKITAKGGQVAMPKMEIPGVGLLAYVKDLDGNIFGIKQSFNKDA